MVKMISTLLFALSFSPLWPLGANPIPGDPFIIVNKTSNELAFIRDNQVEMIVKAATGVTDDLTPEGLFTITVKAENPYYRKKDIPGGLPDNPLGTRWIGFDAKETDGRIYGIHGTNNPGSIGKRVSQGCIRLQNEVIESLYPLVPLGTKIAVVSSPQTFEELASNFGAIK